MSTNKYLLIKQWIAEMEAVSKQNDIIKIISLTLDLPTQAVCLKIALKLYSQVLKSNS